MRAFLIVGLVVGPLLSGCAGQKFDWQKTADSVVRGACRDSSRCDLPCPDGPTARGCMDEPPPGVIRRPS